LPKVGGFTHPSSPGCSAEFVGGFICVGVVGVSFSKSSNSYFSQDVRDVNNRKA
jgi:hypothetical protein